MPLDQVHAGMRGTALTVFQGVKPEAMEVEVLGVLRKVTGPKGDLILIRLHGEKAEYTGVVAGMSGSPVFLDGKLAGALSYRIGEFSKEAIAGVTPIEEMLEIDERDSSIPAESPGTQTAANTAAKTASPDAASPDSLQRFAPLLRPIETPLVFTGFSEATVRQFAPQFAANGIVPVMGAGSSSDEKQPEPLEPGSMVSAVLVRGDMDIAAGCTVTYAEEGKLLACGHPILQFGKVDIPMNKARVVATLASPFSPFKIMNTTEAAGAFVQDRHSGILGRFGVEPKMIPVTLTVRGEDGPRVFHYEVLNNPRLTPLAMTATVFDSLQGTNQYSEETTYRLEGRIHVAGYPDVVLRTMFAPMDSPAPAALSAALGVGDRFNRVYDNPTTRPTITGVDLTYDLQRERRWARLETARTDVTEARPGDEVTVEAVLRPYRGERFVRTLKVKIPSSAPRGTLRLLVSDGDTLDRMRRISPALTRRLDLASIIALLNKEHGNQRLYVSVLQSNPQAMVEDKVMPELPMSILNVMDGMRGTQEMIVSNESALNETSIDMDHVISGSQILSLNIR
jgi:hypothetical protein